MRRAPAWLGIFFAIVGYAQIPQPESAKAAHPRLQVCAACIRGHMEFLASDALRGRGSGTHDELVAATYIASQLRQYGVQPAGDDHSYIQEATGTADQPHTWNVIGFLPGSDPALQKSAILLSAHLDHLGVGTPVNGDDIYNGADDDASGTTAVLEFARSLARRPRRRPVLFVLFGSEETGGLGATYFLEHSPLPLNEIALALEFEMIARRDPLLHGDTLWFTGWQRSNLGPELASHGARIVADPRPSQNFFSRSDNYILARKGIVAHTISSFGMHKDYHQPSDDLAHVSLRHLNAAIQSLLEPLLWLVNSDLRPQWNQGGQP